MFLYWIVRFFVGFFEILPFNLLRFLVQLMRIILQYIVRYREKVLEDNVLRCFPNIRKRELISFKKQVYENLAFILLEGIKGLSFKEKDIILRNPIEPADQIEKYLKNGQSVIAVCPHYNNWEWTVLSTGYTFKNRSVGIYKQINNQYVERYIKKLRAKSSMMLLSTKETRFVADEIPKGKLILLMSDQNPSNISDAIWVKFFNQDIACLHGLEKYALKYNLPVFYFQQERIKPFYYKVHCKLLYEHPQELRPNELTQLFMSEVESTITQNPYPWLWTHKRWKHKKT